jgi:hypothetical protein
MERAVLKYTVPVDGGWHEIPLQDVLHVECQHDSNSVQVWVLDYGHPEPPRRCACGSSGLASRCLTVSLISGRR